MGRGHRFIATFGAVYSRQIGVRKLMSTNHANPENPTIRRAGIARRGSVAVTVA